jgi:uncharacterized membrane protein (UPF0127 family)
LKIGAIYRRDECLIPRVWRAVSAWERTRGLLARPPLQLGEGMLIQDCRLVHTIGMHYPLDLAFLDRQGNIKKLASAVQPARLSGSIAAHCTLELAAGTLATMNLQQGDVLTWRET